jgi:hypothetical protein
LNCPTFRPKNTIFKTDFTIREPRGDVAMIARNGRQFV